MQYNIRMVVKSYRDLRIWQEAVDLIPAVYAQLRSFPREETYALSDQVRRAAVSIAANIAEGQARRHTREFLQHLLIARQLTGRPAPVSFGPRATDHGPPSCRLDAERGTLFLRKDRMIPIGARALEWIARYLETARPRLAAAPDDGTLFLTSAGEPFAKDHLSALVAGSVQAKPLRSACVEPAICSGTPWRR